MAQTPRSMLDSLQRTDQKVESLKQNFTKAEHQDRPMTLEAPVDGRVQQLNVHTWMEWTRAQPLLTIVPIRLPVKVDRRHVTGYFPSPLQQYVMESL